MQSVVLSVFFVVLVTAVTASFDVRKLRANFDATAENATLLIKSLNYLYRGPPPQPSNKQRATVYLNYIEQPLDHFDSSETRTWPMRYMENNEYFKEGGPMFIYLGGEWEITPDAISGGIFVDLAQKHNGILYYTEHRYYGNSLPTETITVPNLKYLHVKQALADVAHFIKQKRAESPEMENSKVILCGGSYSATMVVWFMRMYPELAAGGWASSAPLQAKVNFIEYKEVTGRAIKVLGGQRCYNRIKNGIAELEDMIATNRGAEVKAMAKICEPFDDKSDLDVWSFFSTISNVFASVVQYQSGGDVPALCEYLMQYEDDVTAITGLMADLGGGLCIQLSYKDTLYYYLDTSYWWGAARPWYYQTCNEYGWYQGSGAAEQPFGNKFPYTLYVTLCNDVFGDDYTNSKIQAKVEQTNNDFGGLKPNVQNVYQTHGELDPWSAMGLTEKDGATIIPLTSHCQDFGSISEHDSEEMRASKVRLGELVCEWLEAENC